jgi:uncharacterized protein (DUF58 family)
MKEPMLKGPTWSDSRAGRFLDPAVLARIENLELLARTVVDGFVTGLHRSPYLGLSVDFAEHRAYMPGDDIRRIDWKVYGRTDRFYIKEFEADSNADFMLLLDASRSMTFGSAGLTKLDYARYLAACLAYFAHRQRDRVGLVTFDEDVVEYVPPSAKHLDVVLHTIDRMKPGGRGELGRPLLKVNEASRRRGMVALLSDLYHEPESVLDAVRTLGHRGSDVIVFHVLDPAEVHFPFDASGSFEDLETGERMSVVPEYVREEYRRLVSEHVATLQRSLGESRIDYALFETSVPLDHALFAYLSRRARLDRVR